MYVGAQSAFYENQVSLIIVFINNSAILINIGKNASLGCTVHIYMLIVGADLAR